MRFPPHAFSLRQLQYVVAVAEALSFRRAAERCAVSQPSLSAQVALVEEALKVRLFERDRRRVLLTSAGRELVERARAILLEVDDLVRAAERIGDPLSGTLRIGVIPTISPYLLPVIAPRVRTEFPLLTVAWVEDKTASLVRDLEAGALDAALLALEADLGDVEHAVLGKDRFVLAFSPSHPLSKKSPPASASELRGADVLLLDEGHCFREQALAFCQAQSAHELEFRATSLSTLVQMVAAGAGVTLLPELSLPTEARRADLKLKRFLEPAPSRTIALVWRKRSALAEALKRLSVVLRSAYPEALLATARGFARKDAKTKRATVQAKSIRRPVPHLRRRKT